MLSLILLVFAFVLLVVAGIMGNPNPPGNSPWSWRLLCYGLACWVLTELLSKGGPLLH